MNKLIRFFIDENKYVEFKILCVKNGKTMSVVMREAVDKEIELGIYDDLNKKEQVNND